MLKPVVTAMTPAKSLGLVACALLAGCGDRNGRDDLGDPAQIPEQDPIVAESMNAITRSRALTPEAWIATPDTDDERRVWDLETCVAEALKNNRDLRRTLLGEVSTRAEHMAASRSLFNPTLTAGYEFFNEHNHSRDPAEDDTSDNDHTGNARVAVDMNVLGFEVTPYARASYDRRDSGVAHADANEHSSSVGLTISRQLLRPSEWMRSRMTIDRANANIEKSTNNRLRQVRQLRVSIIAAYYAHVAQKMRLEIRKSRVADAEEFLERVGKRVEKGFAAKVEISNARVDLAESQSNVRSEEGALDNARESLLILMGMPIDYDLDLPEVSLDEDLSFNRDLDQDLARVLSDDERLLNALIDLEFERRGLVLTREELIPDITAQVDLRQERRGNEIFSNRQRKDDIATLSLDMSVPLDGWRGERAAIRQGRVGIAQSQLDLVDLKVDLERNLRQLHRGCLRLMETVAFAKENVSAQESKMSATWRRYQAGTIDNLEVTRARTALDNARLSLLSARIDLINGIAEYTAALPARRIADAEG